MRQLDETARQHWKRALEEIRSKDPKIKTWKKFAERQKLEEAELSRFRSGDSDVLSRWLDKFQARGSAFAKGLGLSFEELLSLYDRIAAGDAVPPTELWSPYFPSVPFGAVVVRPSWLGPDVEHLKDGPVVVEGTGTSARLARTWFESKGVDVRDEPVSDPVHRLRLTDWGLVQLEDVTKQLEKGGYVDSVELERCHGFLAIAKRDPAILGPDRTPGALLALLGAVASGHPLSDSANRRRRYRDELWRRLESGPDGPVFRTLGAARTAEVIEAGWLKGAGLGEEWRRVVPPELAARGHTPVEDLLSQLESDGRRRLELVSQLRVVLSMMEPQRVIDALRSNGLIHPEDHGDELLPSPGRVLLAARWAQSGLPPVLTLRLGSRDMLPLIREAAASGLTYKSLATALSDVGAEWAVDRCRVLVAFAAYCVESQVQELSRGKQLVPAWAGAIWALCHGALEDNPYTDHRFAMPWVEESTPEGRELVADVLSVSRRHSRRLPTLCGADLVSELDRDVEQGVKRICWGWGAVSREELLHGVLTLATPLALPFGPVNLPLWKPDWDALEQRAKEGDRTLIQILTGRHPECPSSLVGSRRLARWVGGPGPLNAGRLEELERHMAPPGTLAAPSEEVARILKERLEPGAVELLLLGALDDLDRPLRPAAQLLVREFEPGAAPRITQVARVAIEYGLKVVLHSCLKRLLDIDSATVALRFEVAKRLYELEDREPLRALAFEPTVEAAPWRAEAAILSEAQSLIGKGPERSPSVLTDADFEEQLRLLTMFHRNRLVFDALRNDSLGELRRLLHDESARRFFGTGDAWTEWLDAILWLDIAGSHGAEGKVRLILASEPIIQEGCQHLRLTPAVESWLMLLGSSDSSRNRLLREQEGALRELQTLASKHLVTLRDEGILQHWRDNRPTQRAAQDVWRLPDPRLEAVDDALRQDVGLAGVVWKLGLPDPVVRELLRVRARSADAVTPDWVFEAYEQLQDRTYDRTRFACQHGSDPRCKKLIEALHADAVREGDVVRQAYWALPLQLPITAAVDRWLSLPDPLLEPFDFVQDREGVWRGGVFAYLNDLVERRATDDVRRLLSANLPPATSSFEDEQLRAVTPFPDPFGAPPRLGHNVAEALGAALQQLLPAAELFSLPWAHLVSYGLETHFGEYAPRDDVWRTFLDEESRLTSRGHDAWRLGTLRSALLGRGHPGLLEWATQRLDAGDIRLDPEEVAWTLAPEQWVQRELSALASGKPDRRRLSDLHRITRSAPAHASAVRQLLARSPDSSVRCTLP